MDTDNTSSVDHATESANNSGAKRARTRLVRRLIWVLMAAVLLLVGYKAARIGVYSWQTYRSGMALVAISSQGPDVDNLTAVQVSLGQLAMATSRLSHEVAPLTPILRGLKPLPVIGGTLAAAPELLDAGNAFLDVGSDALTALIPNLAGVAGQPTIDALLAAINAAGPELATMDEQAAAAMTAINAVPAGQLHPRLAGKVVAAQMLSPVLLHGLEMAPVLPGLAGAEAPKTYLLLIQNNQELRATGGFLSAYGTLTLDDGKLGDLSFGDSYQIYSHGEAYARAPEPMQQHMGIDLLLFRDANWSPDFPRSAQLASAIYTQETGQNIDGVISVDLRATELLIQGLGPLTVPGADEPVTADNVLAQIQQMFERPLDTDKSLDEGVTGEWWLQRKDFIPDVAEAALQKVARGDVDYVAIMSKGLQALDEGAIQIWLKDEDAAQQMAAAGWDGSIQPTDNADFLLYVDTNMGYNKVDSVIERALAYEVTWPNGDDAPGVATATMTYHHPLEMDDHECDQQSRYGASYGDMIRRCYFDYVRLYAPGGSELIDVSGVDSDSVASRRGEAGSNVFSGFFTMEPGSEHQVAFTYQLPTTITPEGYRLVVQKQSGTAALPLTVRVGNDELSVTLIQRQLAWPIIPESSTD